MKGIRLFICVVSIFFAGIGFVPEASAQLEMWLEPSQKTYLQYEPIYADLYIRNLTGRPISFGDREDLKGTLRFHIETLERIPRVLSLKDKSRAPEIKGTMGSNATSKITVKISEYYDLRRAGRYSLVALVTHPVMKEKYSSYTSSFSIVNGTTVWSRVVGVPDFNISENTDSGELKKVNTRKYSILAYNDGDQSYYALKVEDDDNVYTVRKLGFNLGGNLTPKCEIDYLNRINVIVAASAKIFAYYQYDHNGNLLEKQVLMKTSTTPVLELNQKDGSVKVVGGREARRDVDYEEIDGLWFAENMDVNTENVFDFMNSGGIDDEDDDPFND